MVYIKYVHLIKLLVIESGSFLALWVGAGSSCVVEVSRLKVSSRGRCMKCNKEQQKRFPYYFVIAILIFIILTMLIGVHFYALYKGQQSCVQSGISKQQTQFELSFKFSAGTSCPVDITKK